MKAVLELDLSSEADKKYYRIKANALVATTKPPQEYPIEHMYAFANYRCYNADDAHNSIAHDIVLDYAEYKREEELLYSVLFDKIAD